MKSVAVIGGGMITHDQILPSLFQLQRLGRVGEITVCAQHGRTVRALAEAPMLRRAFPGQTFRAVPAPDADPNVAHPRQYLEVLRAMPPRNIVVMALPDPLHYEAIVASLEAGQHVCAVKPLVLTVGHALEIERKARELGLLVAVEYHKRFDDRSLMARRRYREGLFGEFRLGTARLMEKWYYRNSNFQNWCTTANSDSFTYIGCHYVDLVHFITGLLPASVSVYGIRDRYPNGQEGFLWADARVIWQNGACLNVQTSLSFPDAAPGSNTQGLTLYCSGNGRGGYLNHDDQYRGIAYCAVTDPVSPGATTYSEPSADYFQYVDLGGPGLVPVGYGYRSVAAIVEACIEVDAAGGLEERRAAIARLEAKGILATPANSFFNELVIEAGRLSILSGGREVAIEYGATPGVHPKEYGV